MATRKTRDLGKIAGAYYGVQILTFGPYAAAGTSQIVLAAQNLHIVHEGCRLGRVSYCCTVPATSAGARTFTLMKCSGTTAPASGTAMMTAASLDDANINADTVYEGTLSTTEANLQLAAGDRLAINIGGADGSSLLSGCIVTVELIPLPDKKVWLSGI